MSVLLLFSAPFSRGDELARAVAAAPGRRPAATGELLELTERRHGMGAATLSRALRGGESLLNTITHERERAVAYLREGLATLLEEDGVVLHGPASLLAPAHLSFALRAAVVAPRSWRIRRCQEEDGLAESGARRRVEELDREQAEWSAYLYGRPPWDPALYDLVLPAHDRPAAELVRVVEENLAKPPVARTPQSEDALGDFSLAARVQIRLAEAGHDVWVDVEHGWATVLMNRHSIRMAALERELESLAAAVPGVKGAVARVGPRFRQPGISFDADAVGPGPRALLVDDEREFVQTLSERLRTRDLDSSVAYDGAAALALIEREHPEVVVLDLQMPGIDGIEVLRRVRKGHPATQVIILTGHGTDGERELALELGAFAYLCKPVDIDTLAMTMRSAYERIAEARGRPGGRR